MDFEEILTFIEVSNSRSFSVTAEVLHVAQSTVSNRIKNLEDYVGATLIIRDKSGIKFTDEGVIFLKYAKLLESLKNNAIREINVAKGLNDHFAIASIDWLYKCYLAEKLENFKSIHSDIGISLEILNSTERFQLINHNVYDIALSSHRSHDKNYESYLIEATKIIFVASADKFSELRNGIKKEDINSLPILYLKIWDNYLRDFLSSLPLEQLVFNAKLNSLEIAKEFCISGNGCCFMPESMVKNDLDEGTLMNIPIDGYDDTYINVYLIVRKSKLESDIYREFIEVVVDRKV